MRYPSQVSCAEHSFLLTGDTMRKLLRIGTLLAADQYGTTYNAFIGDWYLRTGSPSYWANFPANNGKTLNGWHGGSGGGTCNVFPNG